MSPRYRLPSLGDLHRLAQPRPYAVTIYAQTSPIVSERSTSFLTVKSAFNAAVGRLREAHAAPPEAALRRQWDALAAEESVWSRLSASLAVFMDPESTEVYVLPNELETQGQVADYFDLGQLVRAVTSPQQAYALTLSTKGWNLWEATATTRAAELELVGQYPEDAAAATNRATLRGRGYENRLGGDEGRKVLLEQYAKRVNEAVTSELHRRDPHAERPLFVFATEPLSEMYQAVDRRPHVVAVPGAPDDLRADQIDARMRESLTRLNADAVNARLDEFGDDVGHGLVLTELGDIARAGAAGAVDTLVYDFTVDILGTMDDSSGEIDYAEVDGEGYDLLSRIAMRVLDQGGEVIAVRDEEVHAPTWNGTALAHLRFALA